MIPRNNLTLCLYTTTKGHFGRTDLFKRTVDGLLSQVPAEHWGGLVAHIQQAGEPHLDEMAKWLESRGFKVYVSFGDWKHFEQSHQTAYLTGMQRLVGNVTTPYLLHMEDDWLIKCYDRDLEYWLHTAVTMLEGDPGLVQVRIPRFTDEATRIRGLMAKHGIDGRAEELDSETRAFRHTDYSQNPYVARTRDMRAALAFLKVATNVPQHVEHGLGPVLKLISGNSLPFACLNPARVRVGHLGVKTEGEADNLDAPLMAT